MHLLTQLLVLPLLGALFVAVLPGERKGAIRFVALLSGAATLAFAWSLIGPFDTAGAGLQFSEYVSWNPRLGTSYSLGIDGISFPMVLLATLLCFIALLASASISERVKGYYFSVLVLEAAMLGVFMAQDWSLFYVFWELTLIPLFFLIDRWGGKNRHGAALTFVLYTMGGSVFMLIALLVLFDSVPGHSFGMASLKEGGPLLDEDTQILIFLGFLIGFGVKLPMFPLHTWLPDAHGEANAPVSMLLAGVLLKMGGYALLRFNVQMLPEAHLQLAPALVILGIVNIVYGALNAFAQDNVKRRIACSSVSHMGFVLLGIGAVNALGISGAMLQMVSHGLIAAAMFFFTGVFYERTKTLSIPNMGGLAKALPITFAFFLASSLASLALPGMSGFISEITIFLGVTSQESFTSLFRSITVLLAAIGLVLTPIYLLSMCRRVFFGPRIPALAVIEDMRPRELVIGLTLLVPTLVIGIWPRVAMDLYESSTDALAELLSQHSLVALAQQLSIG